MADRKAGKYRFSRAGILKCPSGIRGLDEITGGGLPRGRPTLVAGSAGCGKTLFAMEFLVRGALEHGEPGVFMAFEESARDLAQNVASLGFDLADLAARKKLLVDFVSIERTEIQETGEYDLGGLFIRLGHAIDSIGAKRVVLDTIESLFAGLSNEGILRSELRRLFRWLKKKGVTAVITAERGENTISRHGLEEYVADCVIMLDHRVTEQVSTRRARVVKYRGSRHETNEFPFLIGDDGIFLLPVTSMGLDYEVTTARISTGIPRLDTMLGGKGYFRGSSILVTGTPGTGKTSIASTFADAACRRGERCIYIAFEEGREQIFRNMRSIGIDLAAWAAKGLLHVHAGRPTVAGLETHILTIHRLGDEFRPKVVVIDPISNLAEVGNQVDVKAMLSRLIDHFKSNGVTTFFTSLVAKGSYEESSGVGISSLMDTWLQLEDIEKSGEHNRGLFILKSRGMAHSNQIREFLLSDRGIDLLDVPVSSGELLMGSARVAMERQRMEEERQGRVELDRKKRLFELKRREKAAKVASIETGFEAEAEDFKEYLRTETNRQEAARKTRSALGRARKADPVRAGGNPKRPAIQRGRG
ncbi:MAG: circadian clock kinase KaiC [Deltaproteobacteria bacterium]|nr:circadian clock kinase KaiC [Deltaproteobacteria bacterium]